MRRWHVYAYFTKVSKFLPDVQQFYSEFLFAYKLQHSSSDSGDERTWSWRGSSWSQFQLKLF